MPTTRTQAPPVPVGPLDRARSGAGHRGLMRGVGPVLVLASVVVAVHLILTVGMRAPIVHPDELGYLANARYLARGGPPPQVAYFPGYSLLLVPIALVTNDPLTLWHSALVVNAVLAGLAVLALDALLRRLVPDMGAGRRLLAVAGVAVFPPFLLASSMAVATSLVVTGFVALLLVAHWAFRGFAPGRWAALGAAGGALVAIHPTMLAVAAALGALGARLAWPWRRRTMPALAWLLVCLAATAVGAWLLAAWIDRFGYSVSDTFSNRPHLTWHWLSGFVGAAAGQLTYLSVATWGLLALGALLALPALWALVARRSTAETATTALAMLGVLAVVVVSSVYTNDPRPVRIDHLMYGRYNEAVLAPMLLLGLAVAVRLANRAAPPVSFRRALVAVAAGVVVPAAIFAGVLGQAVFHLPLQRTNVFGIDAVLRLLNFALDVRVLAAVGLVGGLLLVVAFRRAVALGATALALLVAPSVITGHSYLVTGSQARAEQRAVADTLVAMQTRLGIHLGCVAYDRSTWTIWYWSNYQLFLPGVRVADFDPRRGQQPCSDLVVSGQSNLQSAYPGARLVTVENTGAEGDQALWVLPGAAQDRLAKAGWLLPAGWPVALPPADQRFRLGWAGASPGTVALRRGGERTLSMSLTNAGGAPWPTALSPLSGRFPVRIGVRWYPVGGSAYVAQSRVELADTLLPSQTATVGVPLSAMEGSGRAVPPGRYLVSVEPLQEGVGWFDAGGTPAQVTVDLS